MPVLSSDHCFIGGESTVTDAPLVMVDIVTRMVSAHVCRRNGLETGLEW